MRARMSFNSRTREGCDSVKRAKCRLFNDVSIHAPGRGATCSQRWQSGRPPCFNSRTREGCDASWMSTACPICVSIHAPGRGATSQAQCSSSQTARFNSRTREGCDVNAPHSPVLELSFQFTHPGGVRRDYGENAMRMRRVSIHAPGRGATALSP